METGMYNKMHEVIQKAKVKSAWKQMCTKLHWPNSLLVSKRQASCLQRAKETGLQLPHLIHRWLLDQ